MNQILNFNLHEQAQMLSKLNIERTEKEANTWIKKGRCTRTKNVMGNCC